MWTKIITIKRTKDLNCFSLCALNLFNTWVSQFELNYWNKWTFPRHSNLLRSTCIYMHSCYVNRNLYFWMRLIAINCLTALVCIYAKKISPTPLHHHHRPEPLRQGRMDPCFHLRQILTLHLNAAEIKTHQTRQRFYNLLLSSFGESVWIVSSVCCSYLTGAAPGVVFCCWSPSASGFRCCVFRDGILQILVVTSGYLSYCCLSIISNQSVHSPLTSDINKAFSSTQLPLTGYFLFFRPFSVNPRDGCARKSQ